MLEGWRHATVEEICQRVSVGIVIKPSQYYVEDGEGIRAFRSANIGENKVFDRDWVYLSKAGHEANKKSALREGDVLVVRSGAPGTACVVPKDFAGSNCIDIVFARPDSSQVLPEYLASYTNSEVGKQHVLGNKGGLALQHFNVGAYKEMVVLLPPLPEQRKIAKILRTWDEALEKLTVLRAAKERRLGALRAALLFGRLRLKGLRHNWTPTRLEAVTHELTKRNGAKGLGRERVMGVTKAEGVVPMREQTIAADISRYKRLPPRAFAYNPMRINVGSIAMNERDEAVLVSPDYVVFACNANGLDPDYLDHLRKTSWWAHYINSGGSGSVRQRTYYDDLAALKLPLPELDEQKAIAAVLNTARDDLVATEREIEAVTLQKRGLMQKLLTGDWRVNLKSSQKEFS
jgi:type I restriction enzyme S subunit